MPLAYTGNSNLKVNKKKIPHRTSLVALKHIIKLKSTKSIQWNVTWNETDGFSVVPLSSLKENKSGSTSDSHLRTMRLRAGKELTLLIYSSTKEALHSDRE